MVNERCLHIVGPIHYFFFPNLLLVYYVGAINTSRFYLMSLVLADLLINTVIC